MWKSPCVNIWLCFCQSASKSESLSVTTTNFHLLQCSFPSPDRTEHKYTEQARCLAISTVSSYPNGSLTLVRFVRVLTSLFKVAKSFNLTFKRKKKGGGGREGISQREESKQIKSVKLWTSETICNCGIHCQLLSRLVPAKNRGESGFSLSAEVARGLPKRRAAGGLGASP